MFSKILHVFNKVNEFSIKYPVIRGMVSYGTIWPTGCFLQQIVAGDENFDYNRAARFSLFGCFYVAPTINAWLTIARTIWPRNDIKSAVIKALVEQISYTPFAMVSFYFGMSLLEGKTVEAAKHEVYLKFLPTYQVGVLVWPVLQTVNYTIVPERNRIPFVSLCSLMWSSFLAYMNRKEKIHQSNGGSTSVGLQKSTIDLLYNFLLGLSLSFILFFIVHRTTKTQL